MESSIMEILCIGVFIYATILTISFIGVVRKDPEVLNELCTRCRLISKIKDKLKR